MSAKALAELSMLTAALCSILLAVYNRSLLLGSMSLLIILIVGMLRSEHGPSDKNY